MEAGEGSESRAEEWPERDRRVHVCKKGLKVISVDLAFEGKRGTYRERGTKGGLFKSNGRR